MAFYKANGDTVQSSVVQKTLNAKTYIIDGVTCDDEIQFPNAETLIYWVTDSSAPAAQSNGVGAKQTFAEKALVKKTVSVGNSLGLNGIIPGINMATVTADQVNSHVVKDTIKASNSINKNYISVLETVAEAATTTYSASDVYKSILDLKAEWAVENKDNYMDPTALFVSPAVYALLTKNNLLYFKDNNPAGSFLGLTVIEAPDLVSNAILMNAKAMISGVAFADTQVFDAAPLGYAGGTGYIGELAYVNAAAEFSADFNGKLALKF